MKSGRIVFFMYFMICILLLGSLLPMNVFSEGQASVYHQGSTMGDEIWNSSVIHYVGFFVVSTGHTLTIEAGAQIFMNESALGGARIVVDNGGKLVIDGSWDNRVTITSNATSPSAGNYTGIVVNTGGLAYINYTDMDYATIGVRISGGSSEVNHCTIREASDWGVFVDGVGEPIINNCTINDTGEGGAFKGGVRIATNSRLLGSTIFNSGDTGIQVEEGTPLIEDTLVYNTSGNGINIAGLSTPVLKNLDLHNTSGENIYVSGMTRSVFFENCSIINGSGVTGIQVVPLSGNFLNVSLLNSSFTNGSFNVEAGGNISIDYFARVHVENMFQEPIPGAIVKMYHNGSNTDSKETGESGDVWLVGTHFRVDDRGSWVINKHTLEVTHLNYHTSQQTVFMTSSQDFGFSLLDSVAPGVDQDNSSSLGTTGDSFNFSVEAFDNNDPEIELLVKIEWSHGVRGGNETLTWNPVLSTWDIEVILDPNSIQMMNYGIYLEDTVGNYDFQAGWNSPVQVLDNDVPVIDGDNSDPVGTTGDEYEFNISAMDNIGVDTVWINWTHGGLGDNSSLVLTGDYWVGTIVLDNSKDDLVYQVWLNDTSENNAQGSPRTVNVTDNDIPVLMLDLSDALGTTGDTFNFNITALDNVGLNGVFVNWTHGGLSGNVSLTIDNGYWLGQVILDDSVDDLVYFIWLNDTSDNVLKGNPVSKDVRDNDVPEIVSDNSQARGTTADIYIFNVTVLDNIGVLEVYVNWAHGMYDGNISLVHVDGHWLGSVVLDDTVELLTYNFWLNDTSGNHFIQSVQTVPVDDNDVPVFGDLNDYELYTGDQVVLSIYISDNIDVSDVWLDLTAVCVNGPIHLNWSVWNVSVGNWEIRLTIPLNSLSVEYHFWAADSSGNWVISGIGVELVEDNDLPDAWLTDTNLTTGDPFNINVTIDDNIDVCEAWFFYKFQYTNGNLDSEFSRVQLRKQGGNVPDISELWNASIMIPSHAEMFFYFFNVSDGTNYPYIVMGGTVDEYYIAEGNHFLDYVVDNDDPVIVGTPIFMDVYNTTDNITLIINVYDNTFIIEEVWITFGGVMVGSFECDELYFGATYVYSTVIPRDRVGQVRFNVTVTDRAGNFQVFPRNNTFNFTVQDSLDPEIESVQGDLEKGTGDPFEMSCKVTDNIEPYRAELYIKYSSDSTWKSCNMTQSEISPGDFSIGYPNPLKIEYGFDTSTGVTLYYYIIVYDEEMNSVELGSSASPYKITFFDNDMPVVTGGSGDIIGTTGGDFSIELEAVDNIGLTDAIFYFKKADGSGWSNSEMISNLSEDSKSGMYEIDYEYLLSLFGMGINTDSESYLYYYIEIYDVNGLMRSYSSPDDPFIITLEDIISPQLVNITFYPSNPESGATLVLDIGILDNVDEIDNMVAKLTYHFDGLTYSENTTLLFTCQLPESSLFRVHLEGENAIPSSVKLMYYYIELKDSSGNFRLYTFDPIEIIDIIHPQLLNVKVRPDVDESYLTHRSNFLLPVVAGRDIYFDVGFDDNFGSSDVYGILEFTSVMDPFIVIDESNYTLDSIVLQNGKAYISIPDRLEGYLYYRIFLSDSSGNNFTSNYYTLNISTNDPDGDEVVNRYEPSHESLNPDGSSKGFNGTVLLFQDDPMEWRDSDNDSVGDNSDKLPYDPVAAMDSDGDGYPDELLYNKTFGDSTSNLTHIDHFPFDPSCSLDSDGDGYPDVWNDGKCARDSPLWPNIWLDQYPLDYSMNSDEVVFNAPLKEKLDELYLIGVIAASCVIILLLIGMLYIKIRPWISEKRRSAMEKKAERKEQGLEREKEEIKKKQKAVQKKKQEALARKKARVDGIKDKKRASEKLEEKKRMLLEEDDNDEMLDIDEMLPENIFSEGGGLKASIFAGSEEGYLDEAPLQMENERETKEEEDYDLTDMGGGMDVDDYGEMGLEEELLGMDFGYGEKMGGPGGTTTDSLADSVDIDLSEDGGSEVIGGMSGIGDEVGGGIGEGIEMGGYGDGEDEQEGGMDKSFLDALAELDDM